MPAFRTPAGTDRTISGRNHYAPLAIIAILGMMAGLVAADKVGVPEIYSRIAVGVLLAGAIAAAGLRARTSHLTDWLFSGSNASAPIAGVSIAATALSGPVMLSIGGIFMSGDEFAEILMTAPLLGLALCSLLVASFFRASGAASIAGFAAIRLPGTFLRLLVLTAAGAACLLLLWAQLRAGVLLAGLFFATSEAAGAAIMALVVGAVVVPGGLFGVIRANLSSYLLLSVAFLAPLVFLSGAALSVPVPQLGMGFAALADVESVERQLRAFGIFVFSDGAPTGWPSISGIPHFTVAFLVLVAGFVGMPAILCGFQACASPGSARRSGAWTVFLSALVITAAPAAAAYTKLGIYELFGLAAGQFVSAAGWVFEWMRHTALFSPQEQLFALCGAASQTAAELVSACGDPAYVIGPTDIQVHGEMASLGAFHFAHLPAVLFLLTGAGLLAACLSTANSATFALAVAIAADGRGKAGLPGRPAASRLFMLRVAATAAIAAAAWLAAGFAASPVELTLWAFAIAGSALAPLLVGTVWWSRMTYAGAVCGVGVPLLVLAGYPILIWTDVPAAIEGWQRGVETLGLTGLHAAFQAGFLALIASVATIVVVSLPGRDRAPVEILRKIRESGAAGSADHFA